MHATTITEVIQHLDEILKWSRNNHSRLGYFAALYRAVTVSVKEKLGTGFFDDDARLERVGVAFANRYFEAFSQHQNGQTPSQAVTTIVRLGERGTTTQILEALWDYAEAQKGRKLRV